MLIFRSTLRGALRGALILIFAPWGGGGGALGKIFFRGDNQERPPKFLHPQARVKSYIYCWFFVNFIKFSYDLQFFFSVGLCQHWTTLTQHPTLQTLGPRTSSSDSTDIFKIFLIFFKKVKKKVIKINFISSLKIWAKFNSQSSKKKIG